MPSLQYDREEAHQLLTAADHAAADRADPALVDLYRQLATQGVDLDGCTPDEDVRAQLGMPPLPVAPASTAAGDGDRQPDGGDHPRVA